MFKLQDTWPNTAIVTVFRGGSDLWMVGLMGASIPSFGAKKSSVGSVSVALLP